MEEAPLVLISLIGFMTALGALALPIAGIVLQQRSMSQVIAR